MYSRIYMYNILSQLHGYCVLFFLITQYIAICPKTFRNRVCRSQTLGCRGYIQWHISYSIECLMY